MITLNRTDLDYLLRQVTVNYQDANGDPAAFNYSQLLNALDPSGIREVSGANNNLAGADLVAGTPGPNSTFGQSNQPFLNMAVGQAQTSAPVPDYSIVASPVADADPRLISNLISTMFTAGPNANAAALQAAADAGGSLGADPQATAFIPNAGVLGGGRYNQWFVSFGQFFDHGLDFIVRDTDPTHKITIALSPNDPLYDLAGGVTTISVRRAAVANAGDAGLDNTFGTIDDIGYSVGIDGLSGTSDDVYAKARYTNNTGLTIDQSQTYGSHASVNALLREYDATGRPTGRVVSGNTAFLTDGIPGNDALAKGVATWADVKLNALRVGIVLSDGNVHNAPVLKVDPAGKLLFTPDGTLWTTAAYVGPAIDSDPFERNPDGTVKLTGQDFLLDFNPGISLDQHIITGDGRGNENIGLTAVHNVFHEEHNFQVENVKTSIETEAAAILVADGAIAAAAFIAQWQTAPNMWDGEKLFQAARLITETEYNHIAIDQYVGTLYGALPEFVSYSADINMGVTLEFSQSVFRLGHSMLTETFDVIDPATGQPLKLLDAFLDPTKYQAIGAEALTLGLTLTLGNEVDEFVTPALQQSLLGQPLDLATINIARGRDVGLPTLNELREQVYLGLTQNSNNTNGSALAPYTSWTDFGNHLKHAETLTNMIAAYGRDGSSLWGLEAARASGDVPSMRAAAQSIIDAYTNALSVNHAAAVTFMDGAPFYNETTQQWEFTAGDLGFWDVDLWIGGLAERPLFDGPLGTTFSYVMLDFAQRQQDGDRFYYLYRLPPGTHLGGQIIGEQFADMVMRTTGLEHLSGDIFIRNNLAVDLNGVVSADFTLDSTGVDTALDGDSNVNDYFDAAAHTMINVDGTLGSAADGHITIVGGDGNDYIKAGVGDDTVYGDAGNDFIEGSQGNDHLYGGDGNDTIHDDENDDFIHGGAGDDRIFAGPGAIDTVHGGTGNDELHGGDGIDELFGEEGDDALFGDGDTDVMFGEAGNDYMEGGDSVDEMFGDIGNDWMRGGVGDDHLVGGEGNDLLEGGIGPTANDGDRLVGGGAGDNAFQFGGVPADVGFDVASYEDVLIAITANLDTSNQNGTGGLLDTYAGVDGLVGSAFNDNLTGAAVDTISTNGFDNLLVGGGGSDILTGLSGDDIIVGGSAIVDNALQVQMSGLTIADARIGTKVPTGFITQWGELRPDFGLAGGGLGHILGDSGADGTADIAVFSGALADYTIEDISAAADWSAVKVVDNRGIDSTAAGDIVVGVDTLRFLDGANPDQNLNLLPTLNHAPTGAVTITRNADNSLTASNTLADRDGLGPITYNWQQRAANGTGSWTTFLTGAAVLSLTQVLAHQNRSIQVVATYTDVDGTPEQVVSTQNVIIGRQNLSDNLTGTAGSDIMIGLNGSDTLDGGAGADRMIAGNGNDTYVVDNAGDVVVEDASGGTDTVRTTLSSYTLGLNVENLTFIGTGSFEGNGNALNNVINGGAGSNTLFGGDGQDTLNGLGGNDFLYGEGGNDTLNGGAGNDWLDGGTGADRMIGGAGNDTMVIDDVTGSSANRDVANGNGGTDTVTSSVVSLNLGNYDSVENATLTGGLALNLTGSGSANVLTGNDGANILSGNGGVDTIAAGTGADTVRGGGGADVLSGGGLDLLQDTFIFDDGDTGLNAARDRITDFEQGNDRIDLGEVDAQIGGAGGGGDQAFVWGGFWDGSGPEFTGLRQIRFHHDTDDNTIVDWNNSGGTGVDAQIVVVGHYMLVVGDFNF